MYSLFCGTNVEGQVEDKEKVVYTEYSQDVSYLIHKNMVRVLYPSASTSHKQQRDFSAVSIKSSNDIKGQTYCKDENMYQFL